MPEKTEPSERRKLTRVKALHLLAIAPRAVGAPGTPVYTGRTLDVSGAGARVETTVPLILGQELELDIGIEDRIFRVRGKAVHAELLPGGLYTAGIRFTSILEAEKAILAGERD